ncbi:hypothetical protein GTP08_09660 [Lactococcus lactis]|uniref:Uncharacterized protein n=1 Tax=Lactococcus lactis TaxID=1358 RepID=A0A6M0M9N3_9LACT|nr:hypothetical protein [Lactococcus lactis]NEX55945.1 hypothetical protein [Lactococcus lactis]
MYVSFYRPLLLFDFSLIFYNITIVFTLLHYSIYCFEYIEQFYNNYNPHSANNSLTPNQKEENYFKKMRYIFLAQCSLIF